MTSEHATVYMAKADK